MSFQEKDFGRGAELNDETLKNVSGVKNAPPAALARQNSLTITEF